MYDTTRSHCSKVVIECVNEWNENPSDSCKFYAEFVDIYVSSIYSKSDLMYTIHINPFNTSKQIVPNKYNLLVFHF